MADEATNPAQAELDAAKEQGDAEAAQAAANVQAVLDAEAKEATDKEEARKAKELELAKLGRTEAAAGRALAEMKGKGQKPVSSNPAAIEWPTDIHQATSALKAGILEAGGRVNGQADKLEAVLAVMSIGMKHIRARFDEQVLSNAASAKWHADKEDARRKLTNQTGWSPN